MNQKIDFLNEVQCACERAFFVLGVKKLSFRPMRRTKPVSTKHSYAIGRTNLRTGLITIDIFTTRKREPKKISAILRIICHEIAHHQKPPFKQLYRFKWINRQHYPEFYEQVSKNLAILKKDKDLMKYF